MISIKNSFANCSICKLLNSPSCILETNCEDDLSQVEIVFVAENPGRNEVDHNPPTPLIGKAGQLFRKYFQKYKLNKLKYLITNCVLCQTLNPDGTTGNPDEETINLCKINCMNIIKICNPKLVVLMGGSPMSAFGISKTGITKVHGNISEWEGFKTIVLVHPSFVNRSSKVWEPKFDEAMGKVASLMGKNITEIKNTSHTKTIGKGIFRYKIPEKFYTDEYRLIDIQFLNRTQEVLYIFRDKNNNKIYHHMNDDYICYKAPNGVKTEKILPYDMLDQVLIKYKDRYNLDPEITYEGDVRITAKHAMDYYHFNQGECKKTHDNILFLDIEVDTGEERCFPNPAEARFPINMITIFYNKHSICYVIDNKTESITPKKVDEIKVFNDEKSLMREFIKDFKNLNLDFVSGWNSISFDIFYIYNRLPKLGFAQSSLSKFNEMYVDGDKYICHMPGCVVVDQLFLYKTFTFTKMENYKLGFIAQHELGETKIQLPLPMNEMYWKMLNKTIEYNIKDTELLVKLEEKLQHINLLNELRIICNTSFDSVSSFGQIDSIMVSYLRSKGIASKNSDPHIVKEKYPGAYVYEPVPGIYDWITDFDFASLYPSLIITYNIGIDTFVMKTVDPQMGYDIIYTPDKLPEKINVIIDPLCDKKEVSVLSKDLLNKIKSDELVVTINGCFFKAHKKEFSIFGQVVDMIMGSRKKYKNQMFEAIENKDQDLRMFYYTRQLVYKVLANTLYGVIANKAFRFFDLSLAAAITLSGQEALKTSIIEGDAFMRHLDTNKEYNKPKTLAKDEMFAESDTPTYLLPERSHDYLITGDTDSIFTHWGNFANSKELTTKKINEYCSQIENFLNDKIMNNLVVMHNGDLNFNRLKLKNELVISRGLFLAKKRYAIRVINNEGKDVDEIIYMGVEIKRSDYPSKSKEFLSELCELVLKSEKVSLSKIMTYVKRKEKEFIELINNGDKSISRPVSYTKEINDYKVLPQGVRAMEAWNTIMYNIHSQGGKAYMFWVKAIDFDKIGDKNERERIRNNYDKFIQQNGKLEVLGVPDEEEKLPVYFIPDTKATLKFSFIDRYELLLKPLLDVKKANVLMTI